MYYSINEAIAWVKELPEKQAKSKWWLYQKCAGIKRLFIFFYFLMNGWIGWKEIYLRKNIFLSPLVCLRHENCE